MRDLHNQLKTSRAISPAAAVATNTTTAGQIIDTSGWGALEFAIYMGLLTDGVFTPTLTEGDASNLSDGTTVAAADLLGTIAGATFTGTDALKASLDLGTTTTHLNTVIEATSKGTAGNSLRVVLVGDSGLGAGVTIGVAGATVTIHFEAGVSTVADVEAAITALSGANDLIGVKTAGTGATVLTSPADAHASTALAGGTDSAASNTVKKIGYRGGKRYVRLDEVSTSCAAGSGFVAAVAVQGNGYQSGVGSAVSP